MKIKAWPMKRYAAIILSLLSVVGMITGVVAAMRRTQRMEVRFNKRDLPQHGVRIITSADPDFEAIASKYFTSQLSTSNESLKPFSVFIQNSGHRTVVAYMLVWQMVRTDGQVLTNTTSYSEPGILMGNEIPTDPRFKHTQAIEPNSVRCFSWSSPVSPEGNPRLGSSNATSAEQRKGIQLPDASALRDHLINELSQASDVTVSVDGVFFDDGYFVGPNTTGFFERIEAMVRAKLDLRRDIADASEKGKIDEVFDTIATKHLSPAVQLTSESSSEEYYKYYTKLFAEEINNLQSSYGKKALADYLVKLHKRPHPLLKKV